MTELSVQFLQQPLMAGTVGMRLSTGTHYLVYLRKDRIAMEAMARCCLHVMEEEEAGHQLEVLKALRGFCDKCRERVLQADGGPGELPEHTVDWLAGELADIYAPLEALLAARALEIKCERYLRSVKSIYGGYAGRGALTPEQGQERMARLLKAARSWSGPVY